MGAARVRRAAKFGTGARRAHLHAVNTPHPNNPTFLACLPIVAELLTELEATDWPVDDQELLPGRHVSRKGGSVTRSA